MNSDVEHDLKANVKPLKYGFDDTEIMENKKIVQKLLDNDLISKDDVLNYMKSADWPHISTKWRDLYEKLCENKRTVDLYLKVGISNSISDDDLFIQLSLLCKSVGITICDIGTLDKVDSEPTSEKMAEEALKKISFFNACDLECEDFIRREIIDRVKCYIDKGEDSKRAICHMLTDWASDKIYNAGVCAWIKYWVLVRLNKLIKKETDNETTIPGNC